MEALKKKMPVAEMAEELSAKAHGLSGPELVELVTKIMKEGGYDPQDSDIRNKIGNIYKQSRSVA